MDSAARRALSTVAVFAALVLAMLPLAAAQTSATTGRTITDFVRSLSVEGFDASLGTLAAADVTLAADLDSRVLEITNTSGSAADFAVTTTVSFCGTPGSAAANYLDCIAAADGTSLQFQTTVLSETFANLGPSETAASASAATASTSETTRIADLATLETLATSASIDYVVATLAGFEALGGGGNSRVEVETYANVELRVDYLYANIDIDKLTNGVDRAEVVTGAPVEWTYDVTNTGNTALQAVVVTDDIEGEVCVLPTLDVGQTTRCSLVGIAGSADYVNVATASGNPVVNPAVTVTSTNDSSYVVVAPTPTPTATPVPPTATPVPPTATPVPPTPVPTPTATPPVVVSPSVTPTPFPTREVVPPTPTPTPVTPVGPGSSAPIVDIELATNGFDADDAPGVELDAGEPIVWTYLVTNTGPVDLIDLVVGDARDGRICTSDYLAVQTQMVCTLDGLAVADTTSGRIGDVVGYSVLGQMATDIDPTHHWVGDEVLGIAVTPTPQPGDTPAIPGNPVGVTPPGTNPDEVLALTGPSSAGQRIGAMLFLAGVGLVAGSSGARRRRSG